MSCFEQCPPCKGCVTKDEEIAALRRELSEARGALRACRAGDGCLCSGGPYSSEYPHSSRCLAWQRAIGAATPSDLLRALSSAPAAPGADNG